LDIHKAAAVQDIGFEGNLVVVGLFVGNHNHIVVDIDGLVADIPLDVHLDYNRHMTVLVLEEDNKILLAVVVGNYADSLDCVDKVFDKVIAICYHTSFLHRDIVDCLDNIVVVDNFPSHHHKEHLILELSLNNFSLFLHLFKMNQLFAIRDKVLSLGFVEFGLLMEAFVVD